MKPLSLDTDTAKRFWGMYQKAFPNYADVNRNFETWRALCMDRNSQIFHGPGDSIIMFTDVNMPMYTASVHMLAETAFAFRNRQEYWELLKVVMDLFHIKKLNVFIPGPAEKVQKLYRFMGFTLEGTIRSTMLVDEELVDMTIYGLLRDELEEKDLAPAEEERKPSDSLIERTFGKSA